MTERRTTTALVASVVLIILALMLIVGGIGVRSLPAARPPVTSIAIPLPAVPYPAAEAFPEVDTTSS